MKSLRAIQFDGPDDPNLDDGTAIAWDAECATPPSILDAADNVVTGLVVVACFVMAVALVGLCRGWWML